MVLNIHLPLLYIGKIRLIWYSCLEHFLCSESLLFELSVRAVRFFWSKSHCSLLDSSWGSEQSVPTSSSFTLFISFFLSLSSSGRMSSEVESDSGREAMSWGRAQEEEEASSGRMVDRIDKDEVLSPAPLTIVPPPHRSFPQAETSGEREAGPGTLGRKEVEVESGIRSAPIWKCKFFSSEVNEKQLRDWHRIYRIPDDIEFFIPGRNDRADDPSFGCVALNQAVLAAGPFPRIVRKFLREWRIAPTQLCPNNWRIMIGFLILWDQLGFSRPSVREFNSLYSFKSDGNKSGWWYASVKAKTRSSVITQTSDSIKNWKKFWFYVQGPWQFSVNDAKPDVNIPVRYHELRYISQEPTEESSKRARKARDISEDLRSSSALITDENLISARLSSSSLDRPQTHLPGGEINDISALLKKKTQVGKEKRKVPAGYQEPSVQ
ncbi:Uncharacterized protein Adt_03822 [Abeliophyllum distichum]|uniref:Uncharacterized protein n=1 Tax=Abeliophyllum distichum TaxID=126358 RepID=A0ABD1VZM2_9LAMI